jgi:predicted nucleotide-binding protein
MPDIKEIVPKHAGVWMDDKKKERVNILETLYSLLDAGTNRSYHFDERHYIHDFGKIDINNFLADISYLNDKGYLYAQYIHPEVKSDLISLKLSKFGIEKVEKSRDETDKQMQEGIERMKIDPHTRSLVENSKTDIFLVHGHNEMVKDDVELLLRRLHLEPIILDQKSNNGNTIIEKLENNANVKAAIILLTKDDIGKSIEENTPEGRARQNVIFEMGYFFGKLGRHGTIILKEEGVEIPSDIAGLVHIQLDNSNEWKDKVAKELKELGFKLTSSID